MPGMKDLKYSKEMRDTACINDTSVAAAFFCTQNVHEQYDAALR